jgi:hypothetical protein
MNKLTLTIAIALPSNSYLLQESTNLMQISTNKTYFQITIIN